MFSFCHHMCRGNRVLKTFCDKPAKYDWKPTLIELNSSGSWLSHKWSVMHFWGVILKLGRSYIYWSLWLESLDFILIESSFAILFCYFFWSVNYANMNYILCITFGKYQDTQALFEIYLVLIYVERLSRLSFLSVFAGQ